MKQNQRGLWLAAMAMSMMAQTLPARAGDMPSTVSTSGTVSLQKPPTVLRVTIELTASDKTAKAAVAKLASVRDDAKKKLASLNADNGSVTIGDTSVGDGASLTAQQRQMQMVMAMRNGGKKPAVEKSVTVSSIIKATFALPSASADEVIVKSQELEEKIKAAFSPAAGAGPATKPATPEEQELAEELAQSQNDNTGAPKPGEPQFTYAFPVSDDEAKKLTTDALASAKTDAQLLASAAGMKLGPVYQLSDGSTKSASNPYLDYMDAMSGNKTPKAEAGAREAVGAQPGDVKYTSTVSAVFELRP